MKPSPMTPTASDASLDAVADGVLRAAQALLEAVVDALELLAPELTLTEYRALYLLDRMGPRRLVDVASGLDVTPTTATRLADQLASLDLVERVRLSRDRREVHLTISPQGEKLVAEVTARRRKFVAAAFGDVPAPILDSALHALMILAGQPAAPDAATA